MKEKFEAKIVLDTLKDFTEKIDQIETVDKPLSGASILARRTGFFRLAVLNVSPSIIFVTLSFLAIVFLLSNF